MEAGNRFFDLAGPMTPDEFITGDYPAVKLAGKLAEFDEILQSAESLRLIRSEFKRIFDRKGI